MNNKTQLKEGLLDKIVDNFFSALKQGVSNRYIAAAEKAGVHPQTLDLMRTIEKDSNLLKKANK
jgi:hypothetical protein